MYQSRCVFLLLLFAVVGCSRNSAVPTPAANVPTDTVMPATAVLADTATPKPSPLPPTADVVASPTAKPAATVEPTAPPTAPTADPALQAIFTYLEARAMADVAQVTDLSCAAWKPQAVTEAISFRSMNARLEGVTCAVSGADGGFTLVTCGGKIITTYGGETREWGLQNFVYQATLEGGAWKMCGYH